MPLIKVLKGKERSKTSSFCNPFTIVCSVMKKTPVVLFSSQTMTFKLLIKQNLACVRTVDCEDHTIIESVKIMLPKSLSLYNASFLGLFYA